MDLERASSRGVSFAPRSHLRQEHGSLPSSRCCVMRFFHFFQYVPAIRVASPRRAASLYCFGLGALYYTDQRETGLSVRVRQSSAQARTRRRPASPTICRDRQRQKQRADPAVHGRGIHRLSHARGPPHDCMPHRRAFAPRWQAPECDRGDVTDHVNNEQLYSTTSFLSGNGCFRR